MNENMIDKTLILNGLEKTHRRKSGFTDESRRDLMLDLNHPCSEDYKQVNAVYSVLPLNRDLNEKFFAWFNEREAAFVSKPVLLFNYARIDFVPDDIETDGLIREKLREWGEKGWPKESGAYMSFGRFTVVSENQEFFAELKKLGVRVNIKQNELVIEPQTLQEWTRVHQTIANHFGEWQVSRMVEDVEYSLEKKLKR